MDRKTIFGVLLGVLFCTMLAAAPFRWPGNAQYNLMGPPTGSITCVQHDTNKLTAVARRVRFNAGGTCKLGYLDGTTYTGTFVAGEVVDGLIDQIYDTGTSIADADIQPQP